VKQPVAAARSLTSAAPTCRTCSFFINAPAELEESLPGMNTLSSAWGSVRWDAGMCRHFGVLLRPIQGCPAYQAVAETGTFDRHVGAGAV